MPFIDVSINKQRGVPYKTKLEVEDDDLLKTVARTAIVKFLCGNANTAAIDGAYPVLSPSLATNPNWWTFLVRIELYLYIVAISYDAHSIIS